LASDDEIDFVIGSLHQPRNSLDYYEVDYDRVNLSKLFRLYYDEMMEMVTAGCYDVIGHINLHLRYMSASLRARTDLSPYLGITRKILREVARAGKGIEINTSGLWQGAGITLPPTEVVKMFREEGGEIVTIGSDAHRLERVGHTLEDGVKCLVSAGFDKFAFYKKRIPHFRKI
jgi:histidinol-phosphatase (PHP family)